MQQRSTLLGDYQFARPVLKGIDEAFKGFYQEDFKALSDRRRSNFVNRKLLELIEAEEEPCFLFAAVLDFVERVDREDILHHYTFTSFELWLNHYSGLSFGDNYRIRAKIAGKSIPRDDYQGLFPIGMGHVYQGTHFVTAHRSPDLDTTVASFWGWMDAFAAKVTDGLHLWNVPGGPPASQIEIDLMFRDIFGSAVFSHHAKTSTTLTLTGNDLMSQKGMVTRGLSETINSFDYERSQHAMVVVDDLGFYVGDWRSMDVDTIRQIISLMNNSLRLFENRIHVHLISLFTKQEVTLQHTLESIGKIFDQKIAEVEPVTEYNSQEKAYLDLYLKRVLSVKKGLNATFVEFGQALSEHAFVDFSALRDILSSIQDAKIFDASGRLIENRPRIFFYLEDTIHKLNQMIQRLRSYTERLDNALRVKNDILGYSPKFVSVRADVEEIRAKMGVYQHLTVVYPDGERFCPVGIVQATDLRRPILGSVSLRDFCNRDEVQIPSYLEVLSVIDHHKTTLSSLAPPVALISDVQSSNTLVAEQAFLINDRHSLLGLSKKELEEQLALEKNPRLVQKLLRRKMVAERGEGFYVSRERELLEYLHFLYAILDDTDLLTKVSRRDIECVVELLNRMKSLAVQRETEIVSLEDLAKDPQFIRIAARRILQNEDMYSLYNKVYLFREKEVEKNLMLEAKGKESNLFADTKEQNECCRVGQAKLFAKNMPTFEKYRAALQRVWCNKAEAVCKARSEIDFHLQMISTVVSASEIYQGGRVEYSHKDELWFFVAPTEVGIGHLKRFLSAFSACPHLQSGDLEVEFLGDNAEVLAQAFKESFLQIPHHMRVGEGVSVAVLRYRAGLLNSRKAMISPYLPSLVG